MADFEIETIYLDLGVLLLFSIPIQSQVECTQCAEVCVCQMDTYA